MKSFIIKILIEYKDSIKFINKKIIKVIKKKRKEY